MEHFLDVLYLEYMYSFPLWFINLIIVLVFFMVTNAHEIKDDVKNNTIRHRDKAFD